LQQKEQVHKMTIENKNLIKENFKILKIKGYAQNRGFKQFDEITKNKYIITKNKRLINAFYEVFSDQRFYKHNGINKNINAIESLVHKCG